jgi:hypothetical protein
MKNINMYLLEISIGVLYVCYGQYGISDCNTHCSENLVFPGKSELQIKINNYNIQSVLKTTKTRLLNRKYQLWYIYCCPIVSA